MAAGTITTQFTTFVDEKYIPLESKVKVGIAVALLALPLALCYFLLFQPNSEAIAGLEQKITRAEQDLAKARKVASDLPRYQKELEQIRAKFDETAVILPKSQEIPELLRNISDRGRSAGLDFLSFKPGAETPRDFYAEIPIDISTKGPYHNMGFFLDQVSKLERLVTVNNIKMGAPKKEGGEMLLNSTCRLITYRFTNTKLPSEKDNKGKKKRR
ncbi:type IV pilus inner membrane component PilO [Desulfogranum mediterraneum]|uniref:type 4a pilus biogenesis protein PilO n=1 Tax=Desulfogranum mediterraneum TaxID=160661 RepID=UPI000405599D|nr:type 4a pilus biogenesis protein PilO [Desulfogranum mediterraneum]